MKPLIAVVGPTATGKSTLALDLAQAFGGEIINADSRQMYRSLDIGTGKLSPQGRTLVPHHLYDVLNPDAEFTLALYQEMASGTIQAVHQRGRLPFLVGGSGLYLWSVLEGLRLPRVPPNQELRRQLEERAEREGPLTLHNDLASVDSVAAARIDPRNVRRVVRALEVYHALGAPFSQVGGRKHPPYRTLVLGLACSREELYQRIDCRIDEMITRGWVEEVKKLLKQGFNSDLPAFSSLGYRELVAYVRGVMDLPAAVQRIKFETHRFARHQYAWFRPKDPRIRWLEAGTGATEQARGQVERFLDSCQEKS